MSSPTPRGCSLLAPVPRCRGNGTIIDIPKTCRGSGRERTTKNFNVKISPDQGPRPDPRHRQGRGGGNGGPAGDLYVVHVQPSPLYTRRGDDLIVDVSVGYADAALGASVDVPTPDGPISLKVPAGSQPGKLLKVKGRGAPKPKGGKGDLLARADRAREGLEAGARAARGAAEGEPLMDAHPRYSISVAAELVGCTSRRCAMYRDEGAHPSAADARRHAPLPEPISSGCASSSG